MSTFQQKKELKAKNDQGKSYNDRTDKQTERKKTNRH